MTHPKKNDAATPLRNAKILGIDHVRARGVTASLNPFVQGLESVIVH